MFADVGGVPTIITKGEGGEGSSFMGASGMWIFALVIIFFALAFFGGGFGGRNNQPNTGLAEIAALNAVRSNEGVAPAAFTELNSRLDAIQREVGHNNDLAELRALYTQACATDMNVTQQAFNVSNLVNQTRTDNLLALKDAALQLANCCCDIRTGQDQIRLEASQNTCNIMTNDTANSQRILDKLCENEISRLRDELTNQRLATSQLRQDLFIERQSDKVIGSLRQPAPVPAYSAWPTSVPFNPFAYDGAVGPCMG